MSNASIAEALNQLRKEQADAVRLMTPRKRTPYSMVQPQPSVELVVASKNDVEEALNTGLTWKVRLAKILGIASVAMVALHTIYNGLSPKHKEEMKLALPLPLPLPVQEFSGFTSINNDPTLQYKLPSLFFKSLKKVAKKSEKKSEKKSVKKSRKAKKSAKKSLKKQ